MILIKDKKFSEERALYNTHGAQIENCRFEGEEDGESFLKESSDLVVKDCFMDLRYPFWHVQNLEMERCEMTERCRASLWYDENLSIKNCNLFGVKAIRESGKISLLGSKIVSPEFCWKSKDIKIKDCDITSEYAFLECKNLEIEDLTFHGKYSFQYTENMQIERSSFQTKDAFWHSKNVTVKNSTIAGEYLGWYSENLTLINCHIKGTQPLCYCKGLKLIDCTTEDFDLAFEYSDVEATIRGDVVSIKNPLKGKIRVEGKGEIIRSGAKYPSAALIEILKK